MGWVCITMGAKYPASGSHVGRLERGEGDTGANGIELGLAVRGAEVIIQVKSKKDGDKERGLGISGQV